MFSWAIFEYFFKIKIDKTPFALDLIDEVDYITQLQFCQETRRLTKKFLIEIVNV